MKDTRLKKAKKLLQDYGYVVEYQNNTSMTVHYSDEKDPFLYIVLDTNEFPGFILNWSLTFINSSESCGITIDLMNIEKVALGEPFFVNSTGNLFTGEHALLQFEMELTDLSSLPTDSKEHH